MRRPLYERLLFFAAVAVLGVAAVLAVGTLRRAHAALPVAEGSYSAVAGIGVPDHGRTACGVRLARTTLGIENPVLPCGAALYLSYKGRSVLANVIGHEPVPTGRDFELSRALARSLRLPGTRRIAWSYAGS